VQPTADGFREIDPRTLIDAMRALGGAPDHLTAGALRLSPVRDGDHLPLESDAHSAGVPLIVGYTSNEWAFFDWNDRSTVSVEETEAAASRYTDRPSELVNRLREEFPDLSLREIRRHILNFGLFVGPVLEQISTHSAAVTDSWLYVFDEPSTAFEGRPGACHSLDLAFVFDVLDDSRAPYLTGENASREVARSMHGAWVTFMATGEMPWPRFEPQNERYQRFAREAGVLSHPLTRWRAIMAEFTAGA
jgi:para-nitrobenzyl esterase